MWQQHTGSTTCSCPPTPPTSSPCPPTPARYHDSARCLNTILGYINRVKQFHARSAAYEQILKKNEQMYALLAISCALSPAAVKSLDEAVHNQLKEKTAEKMQVGRWGGCRGLCAGGAACRGGGVGACRAVMVVLVGVP